MVTPTRKLTHPRTTEKDRRGRKAETGEKGKGAAEIPSLELSIKARSRWSFCIAFSLCLTSHLVFSSVEAANNNCVLGL